MACYSASATGRLLLVGALVLLPAACTRRLDHVDTGSRKVLFVGVDGLDLGALKPVMDGGQMPRLAELKRRAVSVVLIGEHGSMDPDSVGVNPARTWTTIATGVPVMRTGDSGNSPFHNVRDVTVRVKDSYEEVPATSQHRRAPALWNILSAAGVRCAVSGWWTTWPAEPVDGYVVSDRFFLDQFGVGPFGPEGRVNLPGVPESYRHGAAHLTWPEDLAGSLAAELKPIDARPALPAFAQLRELLSQTNDGPTHADLRQVVQALRGDHLVAQSLLSLLKKDPAIRFAACHFDALDVASQLFWMHIDASRWQQSSDPIMRAKLPADFARCARVIPQVAAALDTMIGELADAMGPDTVVALACDHALAPDLDADNRDYDLDRLLERIGLLVRDKEGQVDWAKSRVFDRGGWPANFIRLVAMNYVRDWPKGFVADATQQERVAAWKEVEAQLLGLKIDKTWLKPNVGPCNDLFIGSEAVPWDMHFAVSRLIPADAKVKLASGDVPFNVLFPPRRTSAKHVDPGFFLLAFPGEEGARAGKRVAPMGKDAAAAAHVAPVILALFGIPRPELEEEVTGNADMAYWMLDRDLAHRIAVMRVESYADVIGWNDPASSFGRQRALLHQNVEELGGFGNPPVHFEGLSGTPK